MAASTMNQTVLGSFDDPLREVHRACATLKNNKKERGSLLCRGNQRWTSRHETPGIQRRRLEAHAQQRCPAQREADNKS